MTWIELLAALGALGLCMEAESFCSWVWLWQLPLRFVGIWLALVILTVALLFVWSLFISLDRPVQKDDKLARTIVRVYSGFVMRLVRIRLHIKGLDRKLPEGRFVVACNHLGVGDPVILLHCHLYGPGHSSHLLSFLSF